MSKNGALNGGRALTQWIQEDATKGSLLQKIITGVNTLASNLGGSAVGRVSSPPPIAGLNVSVGGEYAHFSIDHPGAIQQGCRYGVELATNSSFQGAWPVDFGASRTHPPIHLAPLDADGNAQKWYARALAQNPGSDPTEAKAYGGNTPTPITTTGTTRLTWAPSTGSGTAANTGQQVGWFMGKQQTRPK